MRERFYYDGMLFFNALEEKRAKIEAAASARGLQLSFYPTAMEFIYIGRDSDRWVVQFLGEIAETIGDADGEIVCEIPDDEKSDPDFEFFSIKKGKLYIEDGIVVRSNKRLAK